jgi:hypothetical protein
MKIMYMKEEIGQGGMPTLDTLASISHPEIELLEQLDEIKNTKPVVTV